MNNLKNEETIYLMNVYTGAIDKKENWEENIKKYEDYGQWKDLEEVEIETDKNGEPILRAIQISFVGATKTKRRRLKARMKGYRVSFFEEIDSDFDIYNQAYEMSKRIILQMNFKNIVITGFGVLPNGDFVATLGEVNK